MAPSPSNLFHMRGGKIVDRREFFWEDLPELMDVIGAELPNETVILSDRSEAEGPAVAPQKPRIPNSSSENPETANSHIPTFHPGIVFSALLKQLYIDQHYVPRSILVPVDFGRPAVPG